MGSEKMTEASEKAPACQCQCKWQGLVGWRQYCFWALVLSAASVLVCAVNWSQGVSTERRLRLIEERLSADDPQLLAKIESLIDARLLVPPVSDAAFLGRVRTVRQAADCACPPGNAAAFLLVSK